ncbi:MAG TPA: type II secretion system protein [Candidatus Paceibacterota bacterium]
MKKNIDTFNAGFTLIELLVVIAIIGLLAAVVLASVGSARNKGADAAVKQQLNAARSQGELFAGANRNSYDGVCVDTQANYGFASILLGAAQTTGSTVDTADTANAWNLVGCVDATTTWVVEAPLTSSAAGAGNARYWCVDSSGNAATTSTALGAASVRCP